MEAAVEVVDWGFLESELGLVDLVGPSISKSGVTASPAAVAQADSNACQSALYSIHEQLRLVLLCNVDWGGRVGANFTQLRNVACAKI
ncbi:hypothetical protein EmuJ_000285300 [Echinococcus multilocularis]|uniref:Uncharacterized protein n=1 Tax=Echinococcus multilocularis TaxID=6211 RepID=A0A068XT85_ECHMU|nr:hypothetical protein EmuJ_000285300 [Echinococcus multilocularis]